MTLPGEGLSPKDVQNLSDKIISEVFGNEADYPPGAYHTSQETTNMPLPEEATAAGSLKFFTEMPSGDVLNQRLVRITLKPRFLSASWLKFVVQMCRDRDW